VHYRGHARVLAVAVFGSVSTGAWHEPSDVDLDIVTGDLAVPRLDERSVGEIAERRPAP
jgi:predicted nucleotidyltransferase